MDIESFFLLENFSHQNLWGENEPVWSPLLRLSKYLSDYSSYRIEIEIPDGVFLKNKDQISIGKGTQIDPGALIEGPCVIGENCFIGHGCYLRGPVILGDFCHVGHSTEVKHSVLLNHAAATHFVYLGDSILGAHANLGAGVKSANLRLDRNEVSVLAEGGRKRTGLKKFGAIVGDFVQIGCNSVLNPGTLIGRESFSYALMNVSGSIPPRHQISQKGVVPIKQKIVENLLCKLNPHKSK